MAEFYEAGVRKTKPKLRKTRKPGSDFCDVHQRKFSIVIFLLLADEKKANIKSNDFKGPEPDAGAKGKWRRREEILRQRAAASKSESASFCP